MLKRRETLLLYSVNKHMHVSCYVLYEAILYIWAYFWSRVTTQSKKERKVQWTEYDPHPFFLSSKTSHSWRVWSPSSAYINSPDYPTIVYPTLRLIRHAASDQRKLIQWVVMDLILSRPHLVALNNNGRRQLRTYCCCSGSGVTLQRRKWRGSEASIH
jgi:hypothetical protein